MAEPTMTASLVVRMGSRDIIVGHVTFTADGEPDVTMHPEGLRLAHDTAMATMTVPENWTFNPGKRA